jgi:hypothetical protein
MTLANEPNPYEVPTTGMLIEFDEQVYVVDKTACHVAIEKDPDGKERHTLDVRFLASWQEEGYLPKEDHLL